MTAPFDTNARILVTGHRGLVGSAICRALGEAGYREVLTVGREDLDLRDPAAVDEWFAQHGPQYVFHVAGTVGGIEANRTRPAEFLHDNVMIGATVLQSAWRHKTDKVLYLGSSCIYPRDSPQPIREEYLLTGPLEETNEAYAIAKIAGVKACQAYRRQHGCNFIAAMPTNLYGPNDNFDLETSHVLPGLIARFHQHKTLGEPAVEVWGTGRPRRELLHVDDLADASLFLMKNYDGQEIINVGSGEDVSISELAETVRSIVYPEARIEFDRNRPDGTPRKLLDVSRIHQLGWRHRIGLEEGIRGTYEWFLGHRASREPAGR